MAPPRKLQKTQDGLFPLTDTQYQRELFPGSFRYFSSVTLREFLNQTPETK
jgi:hypothetical protein